VVSELIRLDANGFPAFPDIATPWLRPGARKGGRDVPGARPADQQIGANRMHLHLTSADLDEQQHTVAMALKLGGRHLNVG